MAKKQPKAQRRGAPRVHGGSARKNRRPAPTAPAPPPVSGLAPGSVLAEPTLDRIEADRRALRAAAVREVQSRMDAYFEGLSASERSAGLALDAAPGARTLRVIAQGDSWFDYPLLMDGAIVRRLVPRLKPSLAGGDILNLAHYGDEVRQMLGVTKRELLIRSLRKATFDALLFSGGGNDIVGDQFTLWLKDRSEAAGPADAIRDDVFDAVLRVVRAGYEDLRTIRDRWAPGCVIFAHAYCVPFPQDHGVCGHGPWLFPSLRFRDWHDPDEQREVVRGMMARFAGLVRAVVSDPDVFVDTQAVQVPREDWANEIHPDGDGFDIVTDVFERAIRDKFGL